MKEELKRYTPDELEQAAREARSAYVDSWDRRLADESDELSELQPVKAKVSPRLGARATVGLRLAHAELSIIEDAAKSRGISFSEFVREAALAAASGSISVNSQQGSLLITNLRLQLQAFQAALEQLDDSRTRSASE